MMMGFWAVASGPRLPSQATLLSNWAPDNLLGSRGHETPGHENMSAIGADAGRSTVKVRMRGHVAGQY